MPRRLPWAILGIAMLASVALVLWAGRDTVFRADDWDLLLYRQGFSSEVLLHPHNEHLVALQVLALKGIGAIGGLHHFAYRLVLVLVCLAVAATFFVFARERVGERMALLATLPLLFLGGASDSYMWSAMLGVMASLACGVGAIIVLDREGRWARLGACLLLVLAIAFETNGLFFLLSVSIWLLLGRRWRQLWIPAIPAIGYYAWYSAHGSSQVTSGHLSHAPGFVVELAASGFGALSGVAFLVKHPQGAAEHLVLALTGLVLAALVCATIWLLWRERPRIGARTIAIASLPVAYWVLIAIGRAEGGDAFASRYVYASVLFILMLLVELVRDIDLERALRGWRGAVLLALLAASLLANVGVMVRAGNDERLISQHIRARTVAVELTRRSVDQNIYLEPAQTVGNMRTGWYLNAVDAFGESPVPGTDLPELEPLAQVEADQTLALGARAGLSAPAEARPRGEPPEATARFSAPAASGPCLVLPAGQEVEVALPHYGILVLPSAGTATVSLRRYAPNYLDEPTWETEVPALLSASPDHSRRTWHARVAATGETRLCGTRITRRRLLGPPLPPAGDQHCEDFNTGTRECRFRRYFPGSLPE